MKELTEEQSQMGLNEDGSFTLDKDSQDIYVQKQQQHEI